MTGPLKVRSYNLPDESHPDGLFGERRSEVLGWDNVDVDRDVVVVVVVADVVVIVVVTVVNVVVRSIHFGKILDQLRWLQLTSPATKAN